MAARSRISQRFLLTGLIIGVLSGIAFQSLLIGVAVVLVFSLVGVLWVQGQLPVLSFCIAYQWLFIMVGYMFLVTRGYYPDHQPAQDIEFGVVYSLVGLCALVLGIRITMYRGPVPRSHYQGNSADYDCGRLLWWVIILFSINWLVTIAPMAIAYSMAQVLKNLLVFRYLFLYLLLLTAAQTRRGYAQAAIGFFFVLIPEYLTGFASFKEMFFILALILVDQYKWGAVEARQRQRNTRILAVLGVIGVALVVMGLVWSSGLKKEWRSALNREQQMERPLEKLAAFGEYTSNALESYDNQVAIEQFAGRLSSGVLYFSYTIDRVPEYIPHEYGLFTWRAISHVLQPRFLFPDKESLGGDSWIVRKYAGVDVAGVELNTSVGMGYMGEFYIDFGIPGVLFGCLVFGAAVGGAQRLLSKISPSRMFYNASLLALFLQYLTSYEGNFAKLFGGFVQATILIYLLVRFAGPAIHYSLLSRSQVGRAPSVGVDP